MKGLFPPSSSDSFLPLPAVARADDPADFRRSGEGDLVDVRVVDNGMHRSRRRRSQCSALPPGIPASAAISANRSAVSGVNSAGLSTTVFPAASAGATFHASMSKGKFHGMIWPMTPTGRISGELPLEQLRPVRQRDGRSAGRRAGCRGRASRGSTCRCPCSRATAMSRLVLLHFAGERVRMPRACVARQASSRPGTPAAPPRPPHRRRPSFPATRRRGTAAVDGSMTSNVFPGVGPEPVNEVTELLVAMRREPPASFRVRLGRGTIIHGLEDLSDGHQPHDGGHSRNYAGYC